MIEKYNIEKRRKSVNTICFYWRYQIILRSDEMSIVESTDVYMHIMMCTRTERPHLVDDVRDSFIHPRSLQHTHIKGTSCLRE